MPEEGEEERAEERAEEFVLQRLATVIGSINAPRGAVSYFIRCKLNRASREKLSKIIDKIK